MKVVIATPLYPPDTAPMAGYVKELAKRLAHTDTVTIVTYGHLPEIIEGVEIIAVDKRRILPVRLFLYTLALFKAAYKADTVYALNGRSVELPVAIVRFLSDTKVVANLYDTAAHTYASKYTLYRNLEHFAFQNAKLVQSSPVARPEILPFEPYPSAALAVWDASWTTHLQTVKTILSHGN